MSETHQNLQWHLPLIHAEAAWKLSMGAGITVAVLDSGMAAHPDLQGQCVTGWDFVNQDCDPTDATPEQHPTYHGLGCAGLIAALDDGTGSVGVAPHAKISMVRVLNAQGYMQTSLAPAILWAIGQPVAGTPLNPNPARVISMSLSGYGSTGSGEQAAIDQAAALGCVVVVAAGNDNRPASQNSPAGAQNVICVGATNLGGSRTSYSNYGDAVTIAAPVGASDAEAGRDWDGSGYRDTVVGASKWGGKTGYGYFWGTSAATPQVAGVVALMLSANPRLGFADVKRLLQQTATPYRAGQNPEGLGAGIVNAEAAVKAALALV